MTDDWVPASRKLSTELEKLGTGTPVEPLPRHPWPATGARVSVDGWTYEIRTTDVGFQWEWSTHSVVYGTRTEYLADGLAATELEAAQTALKWTLDHHAQLTHQEAAA